MGEKLEMENIKVRTNWFSSCRFVDILWGPKPIEFAPFFELVLQVWPICSGVVNIKDYLLILTLTS